MPACPARYGVQNGQHVRRVGTPVSLTTLSKYSNVLEGVEL